MNDKNEKKNVNANADSKKVEFGNEFDVAKDAKNQQAKDCR